MKPKDILNLIKDTFSQWGEDKAPQLAAALSYYTVFSLAPLLLIAIAIAGIVFGQDVVRGQLLGQIQGAMGQQTAQLIDSLITNVNKPAASIPATIIGVITLLGGAAGLFMQLKNSLNLIWNVPPKPSPGGLKGILNSVKQEFLSFTMVLGTGFVLLVSLILSTVIVALGKFMGDRLPIPAATWEILNFIVSFGIITLLFAAIYKVLPDVKIKWSDVWIGSAVTAFLFTVGKLLLGLYLAHSGTSTTYGAAGALVVLLLWVYYSAQILFLGAEFTQVYANKHGSQPSLNVVPEPVKTTPSTTKLQPSEKLKVASEPLTPLPIQNKREETIKTVTRIIEILSPVILLAVKVVTSIQEARHKKIGRNRPNLSGT